MFLVASILRAEPEKGIEILQFSMKLWFISVLCVSLSLCYAWDPWNQSQYSSFALENNPLSPAGERVKVVCVCVCVCREGGDLGVHPVCIQAFHPSSFQPCTPPSLLHSVSQGFWAHSWLRSSDLFILLYLLFFQIVIEIPCSLFFSFSFSFLRGKYLCYSFTIILAEVVKGEEISACN